MSSIKKRLNEEPLQKTKYLPSSKPCKALADADGIVFTVFFFFFFLLGNLFNFKRQRHTKEMMAINFLENFHGCFHGDKQGQKMVTELGVNLHSCCSISILYSCRHRQGVSITCVFVWFSFNHVILIFVLLFWQLLWCLTLQSSLSCPCQSTQMPGIFSHWCMN